MFGKLILELVQKPAMFILKGCETTVQEENIPSHIRKCSECQDFYRGQRTFDGSRLNGSGTHRNGRGINPIPASAAREVSSEDKPKLH